jgi:hypothetical protein
MTKSLLRHSELDPFSLSVGKRLLERFPTWAKYGRVQRVDSRDNSHLEFVIPCPNPAVERNLTLSTEQSELTVYFHTTHEHFENNVEHPDVDWISEGIDLAARILADEAGCVTCYGKNRVYADFLAPLPLASPIDIPFKTTPVTLVTLRSWRGKYDRDEVRRPSSYFTSIARFFSMNVK